MSHPNKRLRLDQYAVGEIPPWKGPREALQLQSIQASPPRIKEASPVPVPELTPVRRREPTPPPGRYSKLLTQGSDQRLRIGVDFGTANTCASFVILSQKRDEILDYVRRIDALTSREDAIRFPTVMAIVPSRSVSGHASLAFAADATQALATGKIRCEHLFVYPKLGLVNDFSGISEQDHDVLRSIQARHRTTLEIANSFKSLTVTFPGRPIQQIKLRKMDDVIVACSEYFLCLLKESLTKRLYVTQEQLEQIFEMNTEIGFAAPAFYSDDMLNRFLHQIQAAGWPSHCRIWSEPKCALAAHMVLRLADAGSRELKHEEKAIIIVDVGSGTTDLASMRLKAWTNKTIEFETLAESGGSLCGGRLLDYNIETKIKDFLGPRLKATREQVSGNPANPRDVIGEEEFFQGFDFHDCRRNFDGSKEEYSIVYRGTNLPSDLLEQMNSKAIDLPQDAMIDAHKRHTRRVTTLIDEQITKTLAALPKSSTPDIEILLVGGVTHSPYFTKSIQARFKHQPHIKVPGSVEDFQRPLVALGCILCLGQPTIGRRFRVKQAYGIPIAQKYDPKIHSADNRHKVASRRPKAYEARDLLDLLVMVGDESERKVDIYDWNVDLYNDDGTIYTKDPRNDPKIYPLTITQDIYSTTHEVYGRTQHLEYKKIPEIKRLTRCEISLSQEECLALDKVKGIGFRRDRRTGQRSFMVPVRVILQWHDVRTSWTAEISKNGWFASGDGEGDPVWRKEIRFATVEHHGLRVGDRDHGR